MKNIIGICLIFLTLQNCSTAQQQQFGWLVGTWKLKDKDVYETWKTSADGKSLEGQSYKLDGRDTLLTEEIRLTFDGVSYHYMPDVRGEQGAVDFRITSYDSRNFIAENPQHDFPKLIRYRIVRRENLDWIEASIEGNGKVIPYQFQRIK